MLIGGHAIAPFDYSASGGAMDQDISRLAEDLELIDLDLNFHVRNRVAAEALAAGGSGGHDGAVQRSAGTPGW